MENIYLDRPWTKNYPPLVPKTLQIPEKTLVDVLNETVRKFGTRPALISSAHLPVLGRVARTITYRELDDLSNALAAALLDMGVKPGDRVSLILPNVAAFVISYYAILKIGATVAAANPTHPGPKLAYQLKDSGSQVVICMSLFYNLVNEIRAQTDIKHVIVTNVKEYLPTTAKILFTLAKEKKDGHRVEALRPGDYMLPDVLAKYAGRKSTTAPAPDSIAHFQYTGGTTGVSKAVMTTHRNILANAMQCDAWLSDGAIPKHEEIMLGATPFFHAYGMVVVINTSVMIGAAIVLVPNPRETSEILDLISTYRVTLFPGVPAMYNAVNNHPKVKNREVDITSVRVCISGAAPLPPATKEEFERLTGGKLVEGYGMSETSAASHGNPLVGENVTGSVGMPMPEVDCRIVSLDDGETDMPVGEIGEIAMAGPNIMQGYHGMPTETANVFREKYGKRWLFSGDIGYMDEKGYFHIVDRKKDMALIGGFNVYPNEIDKILKEHPAILEAAVAGVPHPEKQGQEALKAWVVLKPGMNASEAELIKFCEERLATYEVPRRFSFINELPKSAVGKTLRRELIEMELQDREKTTAPK